MTANTIVAMMLWDAWDEAEKAARALVNAIVELRWEVGDGIVEEAVAARRWRTRRRAVRRCEEAVAAMAALVGKRADRRREVASRAMVVASLAAAGESSEQFTEDALVVQLSVFVVGCVG